MLEAALPIIDVTLLSVSCSKAASLFSSRRATSKLCHIQSADDKEMQAVTKIKADSLRGM